MRYYKEFEKELIGSSDYAVLTLVGFKNGVGVVPQMLNFGGDGTYLAYIVYGKDVEIGQHYKKIAEYDEWMRIYDDDTLTCSFKAKKIIVYRSGEMGCIVHFIK